MTVPVPMGIVDMAPEPPLAFRFNCPSCGRKFAAKPDLAGKKIRCNRCGAGVRVPAGDIPAVTPTAANAVDSRSNLLTARRPVRDRALHVDMSSVDDLGLDGRVAADR